jgi:hypothetical protein
MPYTCTCHTHAHAGRSALSNWKPRYFQLDLHLRTPHNAQYFGVLFYSSLDRNGAKKKGEVLIHFNTQVLAQRNIDGWVSNNEARKRHGEPDTSTYTHTTNTHKHTCPCAALFRC